MSKLLHAVPMKIALDHSRVLCAIGSLERRRKNVTPWTISVELECEVDVVRPIVNEYLTLRQRLTFSKERAEMIERQKVHRLHVG